MDDRYNLDHVQDTSMIVSGVCSGMDRREGTHNNSATFGRTFVSGTARDEDVGRRRTNSLSHRVSFQ